MGGPGEALILQFSKNRGSVFIPINYGLALESFKQVFKILMVIPPTTGSEALRGGLASVL